MSKKHLATTTLIAAGLFIASVPVLANEHSNDPSDRSTHVTATASQNRQRESASDRRADRPDHEQRTYRYGGPVAVLSMKGLRPQAQSTLIPALRTESREHNHN